MIQAYTCLRITFIFKTLISKNEIAENSRSFERFMFLYQYFVLCTYAYGLDFSHEISNKNVQIELKSSLVFYKLHIDLIRCIQIYECKKLQKNGLECGHAWLALLLLICFKLRIHYVFVLIYLFGCCVPLGRDLCPLCPPTFLSEFFVVQFFRICIIFRKCVL